MADSNTPADGRLAGRVALVTGAAKGIGRAIAERFAAEGAAVMLADVDGDGADTAAKAVRNAGGWAGAVQADVRLNDDVQTMVARTVKEFGGLAILVNNAGVGQPGILSSMSEEQWDLIIDTNLKGVFLCTKHAVPHLMKAAKQGATGARIINLASIEGAVGSPMLSAYCASKGGVVNYTRACAAELAPQKITVNCIGPNFTETDMIKLVLNNPAMKKDLESRTPLGRLGTTADIANAALFLASDESAYITGHHLLVDGGYTIV